MSCTKKFRIIILFLLIVSFIPLSIYGETHKVQKSTSKKDVSPVSGTDQAAAYSPMPGPGKRIPIGNGYYFIYGFDKKPKLGTVIMKIEIFTVDGNKDTSLEAKADAGMPSMKGAHETGERAFKISKKGDYLLPISIVMPGDWEIRLSISKDKKVIFKGRYNFDI
jgi:hypothetical protein